LTSSKENSQLVQYSVSFYFKITDCF
jgi:hypothetical protein